MTDINTTCSWPEQDAVDTWLGKHKIEVTHQQAMELKEMVTKYRISEQKKLDALIYAVARKFPNESRFETALRYIQEAENRESEPAQQAQQD